MKQKSIQEQVTAMLDTATYNKRNGKLHPDDHQAIQQMKADLDTNAAALETESRRIGRYLSDLQGHYS